MEVGEISPFICNIGTKIDEWTVSRFGRFIPKTPPIYSLGNLVGTRRGPDVFEKMKESCYCLDSKCFSLVFSAISKSIYRSGSLLLLTVELNSMLQETKRFGSC